MLFILVLILEMFLFNVFNSFSENKILFLLFSIIVYFSLVVNSLLHIGHIFL